MVKNSVYTRKILNICYIFLKVCIRYRKCVHILDRGEDLKEFLMYRKNKSYIKLEFGIKTSVIILTAFIIIPMLLSMFL